MNTEINNIKEIRRIYGSTQEEVAKVAGVNRSTISQWETGALKASNTKLEKLSLYFGIGPEFFYDTELDETAKRLILETSKREKQVTLNSNFQRNKADDFANLIENTSFSEARSKFIFSMKVLLATADYGELQDLKLAYQVIMKMLRRLEAIIKIREEEEKEKQNNNQATFYELLDLLLQDM